MRTSANGAGGAFLFHADIPILNMNEDVLNRGAFVTSLSQAILHYSNSESLTIGLYGSWGSGKTSLKNMVFEKLRNAEDAPVLVEFNPWQCTDKNQLVSQFFRQLSSEIKLKEKASDIIWQKIDQYAAVFETDALELIPTFGSIAKAGGKLLTKTAKKKAEKNNLQELKKHISEKIQKAGIRIVVSIDDIDRLSDEEIIAIFQLVKSQADFQNTIYLLTFDYDVVINALEKVQYGSGAEYLEKIVQVTFDIPAPNLDTVYSMLFNRVDLIMEDIPDDLWDPFDWQNLFQNGIKYYIGSLRDVNRYINTLSLKASLLKQETNMVDLLGLVCLQVFEPSLYSKLVFYKDILCGKRYVTSKESEEFEKKKINGMINALFSEDGGVRKENAAMNIMGVLFPRTKILIGQSAGYGMDFDEGEYTIGRRIALPEYFDRYFSFTMENDYIPVGAVRQMLCKDNEQEIIQRLNQLFAMNKLNVAINEIEAFVNRDNNGITDERYQIVVLSFAKAWHNYQRIESLRTDIPIEWKLLYCTEPLINKMPCDERIQTYSAVFNDENVHPSIVAFYLHSLERQYGRFTGQEKKVEEIKPDSDDNEKMVPFNHLLELETVFVKRCVQSIMDEQVLQEPEDLVFYSFFEMIAPKESAELKDSVLKKDAMLIYVMLSSVSQGSVLTGNRLIWRVHRENIEKYYHLEDVAYRLQEYVHKSHFMALSNSQRYRVIAVLVDLEINGGSFPRDIDSDEIESWANRHGVAI